MNLDFKHDVQVGQTAGTLLHHYLFFSAGKGRMGLAGDGKATFGRSLG